MVMPDHWIIEKASREGMIEPFAEAQISGNRISYGPSSYGYDFRLHTEFRICQTRSGVVLDPKAVDSGLFQEFEGDYCVIPSASFVLGRSVEYFRIPRNVLTICTGKSTYARCGVLVNVTPFEPEWEGYVTISLSNTGPWPVKVYAGEGIAQVVFLEAGDACTTSYADRKGKYQAQRDIVLSKTEKTRREPGPD